MASASELPPPGTFGPFIPIARLGEGTFGVVYRVRDPRSGAEYAVKAMRDAIVAEDFVERFLREMRTLASLDHPGIVRIHGSGRTPRGTPYCVMDLLEGEPLSALLARRGRLPAREAALRLARIARAVGAAHARGIVHRDLKPENIIIGRDGAPRLVDFGLSFLEGTPAEERLTRSDDRAGTPSYMAPEQVDGKAPTTAVDVWALGVLLFQLVTGRLPFEAGNRVAVIQAIATREPPLPSSLLSVPAGIDEVFSRCTEKALERRYRTAVELAQDLEAVAKGEPATFHGRARARGRAAWRRVLLVLSVTVLGLAGVLASIRALRAREEAAAAAALAATHAAEQRKRATRALGSFDPIDRPLEALAAPAAEIAQLAAADLPAEIRSSVEAARPLAELVLVDPSAASAAWDRLERRDAPTLALGTRLAVAAGDGAAARQRLALLDHAQPGVSAPARARLEVLVLLLVARTSPSLEERVLAGLDALDRGAPTDQLPAYFRSDLSIQREALDLAALSLISRIAGRHEVAPTEARELSVRLDRMASALVRLGAAPESENERGRREALRGWADHPGSPSAFDAAEQAYDIGQMSFLEGEAASRRGDAAHAIEAMDLAIQYSGEFTDLRALALERAIVLRLEAGRADEALEQLRTVPPSLTNTAFLQLARAWCALLAQGDVAVAVRELDAVEGLARRNAAVGHQPLVGEAFLVRGMLRAFKLDDPARALQDLEKSITHEETEPRYRVLAAVVAIMIEGPGARTRWLQTLAGCRPR
jgi:hypothetical protein